MKNGALLLLVVLFGVILTSCTTESAYKSDMKTQRENSESMSYFGNGPKHDINYRLPSNTKWKKYDGGNVVDYFPVKENISNWNQNIVAHYKNTDDSLKKLMDTIKKQIKSNCSVAKVNIIKSTSSYIYYNSIGTDCSTPDQTSYGKLFKAKEGLYAIQYFGMTKKVTAEQFQAGKKMVANAALS